MYLIVAVAVSVVFVLLVAISRLTKRSGRFESRRYEPRTHSQDYESESRAPEVSSSSSPAMSSPIESSAGRSGAAGRRLVDATHAKARKATNYSSPAPKRAKSVNRDTQSSASREYHSIAPGRARSVDREAINSDKTLADLINDFPPLELPTFIRRGVGGESDSSTRSGRGTTDRDRRPYPGSAAPREGLRHASDGARPRVGAGTNASRENLMPASRELVSKSVAPSQPAKQTSGPVSKKQKQTLLSKISANDGQRVARKSAGGKTQAIRDAVDCSVFAPPVVPPRETFMVQAFVHRPEQKEEARTMAREFDSEATMRGYKSLGLEIARGSKLSFHLAAPGLEVDEPVQTVAWQGSPEAVQFGVTVPASPRAENVISTLTVVLDGVPLGHIKFKLTIKSGVRAEELKKMKPAGTSARHYQKAFISYASVDRTEVLKRVQMLKNLGIEFFQDILDLEPGTRWERQLYRHIDECDLFLLFWSSAAKQSGWVLKEVEYALNRKRDDSDPPEILPVPIEGPPPVPPPDNLKHLHFNDYFLYFLQ